MAMKIKEAKIRPSPVMLIPRTLIISPGDQSSMYGAMWDLMGLGVGFGPLHVSANIQVNYSYLSFQEAGEQQSMHFLRPGAVVTAQIPIQFNKTFGVTAGWRSAFYPPQEVGGAISDFTQDLDNSIWHIGQAFVTLNVRFPYTAQL